MELPRPIGLFLVSDSADAPELIGILAVFDTDTICDS